MPQVPYTGVPAVAPSEQGTPNISIDTPIAAFGGTVAAAINSVGQAAQHVGGEIMSRAIAMQEMQNDTMAKEADAKYIQRTSEIHASFNALEGQDAVRAYPKYVRDLQALRRDYRNALPNDDARRRFDGSSLSFMSRNIFNGAGHAATQQRAWSRGASNARIDAVNNDVARDGSPGALENGVRTIEEEVRSQEHGWSEDQVNNEIAKRKSKLIATQIQGIARTEPFRARQMLEENRANLTAADIPGTERVVQSNLYNAGSRRISDEVNPPPVEGEDGAPLQDRIDAGMRRAREIAPDDPGFADFVRDRIITDFNRQKSIVRDYNQANRNVIESALMGGFGNGQVPTSIDELTGADPRVADAWQRLDARTQRSYVRALAQNARGEIAATPENLARYNYLRGLANSNEGRDEFLGVDIVNERMPIAWRRQLLNQRQSILRVGEADPRLTRAMQTLRPMLESAGITTQRDRQRFYQFQGALQDALTQWQEEKKKFPTQEEVQQIGARLMQEQVTPGAIFGNIWPNRTPLFEATVPNELVERFKADPRFNGRQPTDVELERFRRQYIGQRYQELFGGRSKSDR